MHAVTAQGCQGGAEGGLRPVEHREVDRSPRHLEAQHDTTLRELMGERPGRLERPDRDAEGLADGRDADRNDGGRLVRDDEEAAAAPFVVLVVEGHPGA